MKVEQPVDRERLPLLCLPTLAVRVTATCNNKKNTQTVVRFNFSFLYRSAFFLFFSISNLLLFFCSVRFRYSVLLLQTAGLVVVEGVLEVATGERGRRWFYGHRYASQLQWKAGRWELLCGKRAEEEGAADQSGSVGDAAADGEDRLRGEWGGGPFRV